MTKKRHGVLRRSFERLFHPIRRRHRHRAHRRTLHRHRHVGLVQEISSERFEMNAENRRLLGLDTSQPFSPSQGPPEVDESQDAETGEDTEAGEVADEVASEVAEAAVEATHQPAEAKPEVQVAGAQTRMFRQGTDESPGRGVWD